MNSPPTAATTNKSNTDSPKSVKPRRLATYLKLSLKSSESESHSPDPTARGGISSVEKDKKFSNFRKKIPLPFCRVNWRKLKTNNSNSPKIEPKTEYKRTLTVLSTQNIDQTQDELDHLDPEIVVSLIDDKLFCANSKTTNQLSQNEIELVNEMHFAIPSKDDLVDFFHKPSDSKSAANPKARNINLDYLGDDELIRLAVEIFKKSPETRNPHELRILAKCVSAVEFFKRYDQNTVQNCLKNMYYVSLNQGDTVFEMNTIGKNFWIVLTGSVSVIAKIDKRVGKNENGEDIIAKVPSEIRVLHAGSAFGELALMDNKPRSATIKCKEVCQFAVLEKAEFKALLNEKEKKNLYNSINFLVSCPILKILPYHLINWLFYNNEVVKYSKGNVMYEEGDLCKNFYIIKSGEFKISKQIEFEEDPEFGFRDPLSKLMKKQTIKENVELAILGEKENFGEEEILITGGSRRKYTVVCHSAYAEVWEIPKDKLEKKLLTYQGAIEWFKNSVDVKQKHYNQRLKNIRDTRFNSKSPLVLNRQRTISPMRLNTINFSPKNDHKQTGVLTNPDYIGTGPKMSMSLTPKTRAVFMHQKKLEEMNIPGQDLLRFKNEIQLPHPPAANESYASVPLTRTKSENKSGTTVITRTERPPEPQPAQLSLMRINIEQLKAKRKITRSRNESFANQAKLFTERRKEPSSKPLKSLFNRQNTTDAVFNNYSLEATGINSPPKQTPENTFFSTNSLNIHELHRGGFHALEPHETGVYPSLSPRSKLLVPKANTKTAAETAIPTEKVTMQNLKKVVRGSKGHENMTERQLSPTFYNRAIARVAWETQSIGATQKALKHSTSQEYGKIKNIHINDKGANTYLFLKKNYFAQKSRDSGVIRGAFSQRQETGLHIASFDRESSSPKQEGRNVRIKTINSSTFFKKRVKRVTTSTLQTEEGSVTHDDLRRTML